MEGMDGGIEGGGSNGWRQMRWWRWMRWWWIEAMDGGRGGDGWKQWVEEAMEVDGMLEVMQVLEVMEKMLQPHGWHWAELGAERRTGPAVPIWLLRTKQNKADPLEGTYRDEGSNQPQGSPKVTVLLGASPQHLSPILCHHSRRPAAPDRF